jgi:apolipoprotein N-acyltransferase
VPAGIWLIRKLDRGTPLPLIVTVPVVWTALEYVRAHALTGFAWYFLGHTQHDFLAVIQISDIAGAYGVTFVVAAVNALVFELIFRWSNARRFLGMSEPVNTPRLACTALRVIAVAALVGGTIGYGAWQLRDTEFAVGPRVALLQGNIDQRIKNEANQGGTSDAVKTMFDEYASLCHKAALQSPRPDLIVWPETSWPGTWIESPAGVPHTDYPKMRDWFARWGIPQLVGLNSSIGEEKSRRLHNSALLFDNTGAVGKRYDKMHRVPFGEYVPFLDWFPWMSYFAPYDFDYSIRPGTEFTRFPAEQSHFGVLICYEDTNPYLARQYVTGDSKVDFLVNISNDGWFDGSSEHEEHLAICRFRAVESRRAVVRAVNMGVSAIIDGNGRVLAPTQVAENIWEIRSEASKPPDLGIRNWKRFKKVSAVIAGDVPVDHRGSLYAAWGDWLPQGCWLFIAGGLTWSFTRRNARMQPE